MNIRLEKYKVNRIAGMNRYNAAIAAKFSENMARHHSKELEDRVKTGIADALEQAGITDKRVTAKINNLLDAQRVISCNVFIDKSGEMKKADGKSMDFVEVPDCNVQLRTVEHINKLKGNLKEAPLIENHTHYEVKWLTKPEENRNPILPATISERDTRIPVEE